MPKVHLLPYHRYGVGKYQMLDREYGLSELEPPDDAAMLAVKQLFELHGIEGEIVT